MCSRGYPAKEEQPCLPPRCVRFSDDIQYQKEIVDCSWTSPHSPSPPYSTSCLHQANYLTDPPQKLTITAGEYKYTSLPKTPQLSNSYPERRYSLAARCSCMKKEASKHAKSALNRNKILPYDTEAQHCEGGTFGLRRKKCFVPLETQFPSLEKIDYSIDNKRQAEDQPNNLTSSESSQKKFQRQSQPKVENQERDVIGSLSKGENSTPKMHPVEDEQEDLVSPPRLSSMQIESQILKVKKRCAPKNRTKKKSRCRKRKGKDHARTNVTPLVVQDDVPPGILRESSSPRQETATLSRSVSVQNSGSMSLQQLSPVQKSTDDPGTLLKSKVKVKRRSKSPVGAVRDKISNYFCRCEKDQVKCTIPGLLCKCPGAGDTEKDKMQKINEAHGNFLKWKLRNYFCKCSSSGVKCTNPGFLCNCKETVSNGIAAELNNQRNSESLHHKEGRQ